MANVTAIIPTYNEELNIKECLLSLNGFVERIILMDNNSTDRTKEIAESFGAIVLQSSKSYKERLNIGIEHPLVTTKWVLNIDADERLTPKCLKELNLLCDKYENNDMVTGIVLKYENIFMGKHLHFGFKPRKMRLFKKGYAYLENKELDEHFILKHGTTVSCKSSLIHKDFKGIKPLIIKWNEYAYRSANEIIDWEKQNITIETEGLAKISKFRRFIKYKVFIHLPINVRSQLLFYYYYFLRLGFLDGEKGRLFLFLQTYWYRYLIDAYLLEYEYHNKKEYK